MNDDQRYLPIQYSRYKLISVNFMQIAPAVHLKLNISITVNFHEKDFLFKSY